MTKTEKDAIISAYGETAYDEGSIAGFEDKLAGSLGMKPEEFRTFYESLIKDNRALIVELMGW
jgi:hypothetical protein